MAKPHQSDSPSPLRFESFGVNVMVTSNRADMVAEAEAVARRSLLGKVRLIKGGKIDHHFELTRTDGGTFRFLQNGERIASGRSWKKFFKFFDSMIRVAIGEYAPGLVFMHAGAVGWRGRAIILPADSFRGKTTLVAELVRNGAEYYSDEFAVFDADGLLLPYPRPLSMRAPSGPYREYELTPEELGGTTGTEPIPVGMVLLTEYKAGSRWSPRLLTHGQGIMEMMPYALPLRHRPDFALRVLNNVASRAIIASSLRGTANKFAKTLLNFVDKQWN